VANDPINTERSDETGMSEIDMSKNDKSKNEITDDDKLRDKKKRKKKIILIIIIISLVTVIGLLIYFLWFHPKDENSMNVRDQLTPTGRGFILTPENVEEARRLMEEPPGPDAQYTVSLTTNWEFETWDTPSRTASVDNLASNSRTVYFDVILRETNRLVYSSPYIPLGGTLEQFALDTRVTAGEHPATVTFFLVDDDLEYIADVSVAVTLTILK